MNNARMPIVEIVFGLMVVAVLTLVVIAVIKSANEPPCESGLYRRDDRPVMVAGRFAAVSQHYVCVTS